MCCATHAGNIEVLPTSSNWEPDFKSDLPQGHGNHVGRNPVGRSTHTGCAGMLKIHQRGVQWKQGVVVHIIL